MSLTDEQVRQYHDQGWVAPITVMSVDEATTLADAFARAEADYPDHLHAEHRNNAHLTFPLLHDVTTDARVVDAVEKLIGPDICLGSTVLFVKEPSSSGFVSWHQDAYYMALEPPNFVTAWIALTPSTIDSGCVTVLPGTHRERVVHTDTFGSDNILTRGQEVLDIDVSKGVHLELQPGQMSLHHPWLVHGSQPNRSASRRIGFAMQSYLGAQVRPTRGEHYVTAIRGQAPAGAFTVVSGPTTVCSPEAVDTRAQANAAMKAVLYDGADKTRKL